MTDEKRNGQLELHWVPVTDERGRTRMEMVWSAPGETVSITHAA
ncbi:hypothetical protein GCM10023340_04770 [Nocardioides marinquilinus]|uniref:Uncharacterized protein n=1 Tax=Nocardioides marinquilinus TaxID=1210400 RepID=A0ABP9P7X5_9ACTN